MALATVCTGFEFGTTAGWATGNTGNKVFDTITGTPTISTTAPRTGTYCLEISAAGASEAVQWNTNTFGASKNRGRAVFAFRFVTSLPGGDSVLACFTAGVNAEFVFNSTTGKLAVRHEGQSFVDGPTPVADTWYVIELAVDISGATRTIDWWVDTAAQTQASFATTADVFVGFEMGCSFAAQTLTTRFDDVVLWADTASISGPKGKHTVRPLNVDTGGTVTLSGTTANFNTFVSNGTLTAWNATTARNNIDEIPPTIGASADGFVQVNLATSDYVEIPMTTYTLAAGEAVSACRMLAPGWATSTTAATIGFRSWNGTTETILQAGTVDPNFDNSTTAPAWVCKMLTLADVDTQGEIDALAFRVGFSSDATPDMGIHAIYAELAVQEATAVTIDGTASITGAGTLAALATQPTLAALAGAGVVVADGALASVNGTATLAGAGTLTANATQPTTASLTGAGVVTALVRESVVAALTGAGTVTPLVRQGAITALAGAGVVAPLVRESATTTLTGAGTLAALATESASAGPAGAGSLTGNVTQPCTAAATGSGVLSATGSVSGGSIDGVAALVGSGTLTVLITQNAKATPTGAGTLTAAGYIAGAGSLTGAGSLAATSRVFTDATVALVGAGVLVAEVIDKSISADGRIVTTFISARITSMDASSRATSATGQRITSTAAANRVVSTAEGGRL